MSNLDNIIEINALKESALDSPPAGEEPRRDEETLADFLMRAGKSSVPDVAVARVKKPKRPEPTFTFPSIPPLF